MQKELTSKCPQNCPIFEFKTVNVSLSRQPSKMSKNTLKSYTTLKKKTPMKKVSKRRVTTSKKTYDYVIERDKYHCVLCGALERLELHHINGRGPDKTNDVDNCVMLCQNCHHFVVHADQKKYRPILLNYISEIKEKKN